MFSVQGFPAKHVFWPKNGPVPGETQQQAQQSEQHAHPGDAERGPVVVVYFQADDRRRGVIAQLRADFAQRGDEVRRGRVESGGVVFQIRRPGLLQFGFRPADLAAGVRRVVPIVLQQRGRGGPVPGLTPLDRQDVEFPPETDFAIGPVSFGQFISLHLQQIPTLRSVAEQVLRRGGERHFFARRQRERRLREIGIGDCFCPAGNPKASRSGSESIASSGAWSQASGFCWPACAGEPCGARSFHEGFPPRPSPAR